MAVGQTERQLDASVSSAGTRRVRREPPRFGREIIGRGRLLARMASARKRRVVLLCAPAGFGKTIAAAQVSRNDPRPACWIQLEDVDNDPIVFVRDLVNMLEGLGPIAVGLARELESRAPRINEVVVPLLQEQLAACDPFLVVLDDVDRLSHPGSWALLAFLVDKIPQGSQIVLATRRQPDLPLARLRAGGEVLDIGATELALDPAETRALLASKGLELGDDRVEAIRERAEGWVAGISLAMLVPDGLEASRGERSISATQSPAVAAYLLEEVVEQQPPDLRRFMLASSVLRHMNPALCDAALGITESGRLLSTLTQTSAFVFPDNGDGEWYRYHDLFRELLQTQARSQTPEVIHTVLSRAAAWHEQHGDPGEAFEYAHACGDLRRAGRILLHHLDRLLSRGQINTARAWVARCTPEELASNPLLSLGAAWVALLSGDAVEAHRLAAVAGAADDLDAPSPDGSSSLRSSLANLRAALGDAGVSQMLRDGEFVIAAETRAGTRWVTLGWRAVGIAHLLTGRPQEAIAAFSEVLALTRGHRDLNHVTLTCLGYSALAAADAGDWRRARKWARDAHALTNETGLEHIINAVPPYTAHATVLRHDGLLHQAAKALEHVRRLLPAARVMPWGEADMSLRCGDLSLDLGDIDAALELADLAREALAHYPDPGTLPGRLDALDMRLRSGRELELTPSELRLAPFLATHLSLQEIGERMYLSRATIKTHTDSIYRKLSVQNRSEAVDRLEAVGLLAGQGFATTVSRFAPR